MHDKWIEELKDEMFRLAIGLVVFFLLISTSFLLVWLLVVAPPDPADTICHDATTGQLIDRMLRGQHELGCPWQEVGK